MIKHIKCDIFKSGADIICHQVNCQGVMGSGIAKQVREKYPVVYEKYKHHCDIYSPKALLGVAQFVGTNERHNTPFIGIFNLYAQEERVEKDIKVSSQEMLEMGKTLYENIQKYGAPTWYDWCCNNWGTKWNACNVEICDNTLYFSTAWSFAEPVMAKLAELCAKHNVGFEGEWADEDMGSNTGCFDTMGDEKFYCSYYDDCSHNAYAAYVRCNGESDCLGVDEDGNYYRYECGESCPNYEECMG